MCAVGFRELPAVAAPGRRECRVQTRLKKPLHLFEKYENVGGFENQKKRVSEIDELIRRLFEPKPLSIRAA